MSPFVILCLYRVIALQLILHIYSPRRVLVMYQCGWARDIFYGIFMPCAYKQVICRIYGGHNRSQNCHRLVVKPSDSGQLMWCVHSPPHCTTRNCSNGFILVNCQCTWPTSPIGSTSLNSFKTELQRSQNKIGLVNQFSQVITYPTCSNPLTKLITTL